MKAAELYDRIMLGMEDGVFAEKCSVSRERMTYYRNRAAGAVKKFTELFGDRDVMLLSVGGRSEVAGNHTDHNCGKVMCTAVDLDMIAVAAPSGDSTVTVQSEGFSADVVEADAATEPDESRFFTSAALIAGMERAFLDRGLAVGGFFAYTVSDVLKGSGMSSSAVFEVMIGNIINHMFNGGAVDNAEIAKMAQFSENVYFGKPCGLMDQTACAVGGFLSIDFEDPSSPLIHAHNIDFNSLGYSLCLVDTGGSHADLNADYASVPYEMKAAAAVLGKQVLRQCSEAELLEKCDTVRAVEGDRAMLRALHFFRENKRVEEMSTALERGDTEAFLEGVRASGISSYCLLQNVYSTENVREQGLSLALCLTEMFFENKKGAAWRLHGGGFAGTVQVFVPSADVAEYKEYIERFFKKGSCHVIGFRRTGAVRAV